MKNLKSNPAKTVLTISIGLIVLFALFKWQLALYSALAIGLAGVFSSYLSIKIEYIWFKLTWVLSLIIPNIILGIVFYLFLFPISILARIFGNSDPLEVNKQGKSMFKEVNKEFCKHDFEVPW